MNKSNIDKRRTYAGPEILRQGFRPFFLSASLWAASVLLLWILMLSGVLTLPLNMVPADWHAHELLFGYTSAVIAGFLLTAVPNWTGRYPISGWPLLGLFAIWLAGRLVILMSAFLSPGLVAAVDLAFPLVLALAIARELIAGKNWRNLRVLVLVALFGLANGLFHYEVWQEGIADVSLRLGVSVVLTLIMVIGGRVIPSFTRNWLVKRSASLPIPFGRFDGLCIVFSIAGLLMWSFFETAFFVPYLLGLAGALNLLRLARWRGYKTFSEPLVLVLHVGFLLIPLGFFAVATNLLWPNAISSAGAVHIWTAGAIAVMSMAIMTRASLGHTGQPLRADWAITSIYVSLFASVVLRIAAEFGTAYALLLQVSATGWFIAFGGFALRFAPSFMRAVRRAA